MDVIHSSNQWYRVSNKYGDSCGGRLKRKLFSTSPLLLHIVYFNSYEHCFWFVLRSSWGLESGCEYHCQSFDVPPVSTLSICKNNYGPCDKLIFCRCSRPEKEKETKHNKMSTILESSVGASCFRIPSIGVFWCQLLAKYPRLYYFHSFERQYSNNWFNHY